MTTLHKLTGFGQRLYMLKSSLMWLATLLVAFLAVLSSQRAHADGLWEGEEMRFAAGFPFVTRLFETSKEAPVVVVIPGANSMARVFYGGEEVREEDFLAYWLQQKGYNVLGISYPLVMQSKIFDRPYPEFTVRAWGYGAAELTQNVMEENQLTGKVIVAVWSMGGKSVQPFAERAQELGMNHDFHVALASTPAVPTSKKLFEPFKMHETGVLLRDIHAQRGTSQLDEIVEYNEREEHIIPFDLFRQEYTGQTPAQLGGRGLRYDKEKHELYRDPWADMQDTKFFALDFPLVAKVVPTWPYDARHVLTDHATWGYHNANTILHGFVGGEKAAKKLSNEKLQAVRDISRETQQSLIIDVEGNHFFFIGEKGAKDTAAAIAVFDERIKALKHELNNILN